MSTINRPQRCAPISLHYKPLHGLSFATSRLVVAIQLQSSPHQDPANGPWTDPSCRLSLTCQPQVSDNRFCVAYVSDNTEGLS